MRTDPNIPATQYSKYPHEVCERSDGSRATVTIDASVIEEYGLYATDEEGNDKQLGKISVTPPHKSVSADGCLVLTSKNVIKSSKAHLEGHIFTLCFRPPVPQMFVAATRM